jgi:preprotein translocase subunit SecF
MELFKVNTKIDFMRQRKWAAVFSLLLFIFSVGSIAVHGLNLGLDFLGGAQMQVSFSAAPDLVAMRANLEKSGIPAVVQRYGSSLDALVKVDAKHSKNLKPVFEKLYPTASVKQTQVIGPQVGKQLLTNGILAVVISLFGTMLYIALRFEYRFAVSAAIALIHDPVLILGLFSFFHLEFNLIVLAGVLTVIGYSLNDTIVVYDRVRENFQKLHKLSPVNLMNLSINQTLSRTIMTSGLTLLVVIALFLYGGATVHNFALALIIGIVVGTYSSIYVAGSLAISMGLTRESLLPKQHDDDDSP